MNNKYIRIILTVIVLLPVVGCDYVAGWLPGEKTKKRTMKPKPAAPELSVEEQIRQLQQEIQQVEQEKRELELQQSAVQEEKAKLSELLQEKTNDVKKKERALGISDG
ncbi:MAG TPA: hypothetical protein VGL10_05840 [Gammaproteobacteria bacterium]